MEAVLGAMEAVLGALKPLGSWLMPKVEERFSYLFSNKKHIEELEKEVKKLGNKKIDIDTRVQGAKNQGEDVIQEADEWQKQAEQILEDSHKFLERTRNSDAKCCFKLCYNISYLYKNSKEASALHKVVTDRYREAEGFIVVAIPPKRPQITVPYTTASSNGFESRARVLAQIVDFLENDEVNVIGIYGMGGVGKTTLVDKLILQAEEQKLFDIVVKAVVSKTPNFMDIQNQIADGIKFKLEAQSVRGRTDQLFQVLSQKLKKEKILVILDDIWGALDFTVEVGIPRMKGCKVVITSRNKNVLNAWPIKADMLIEVGVLEQEEARRLFMMSLGDYSDAISNDSQLAGIMDDLLKRCGGLPLAIDTLAGVLKGKDQYFWKHVANQLREHSGKEIEGMYDKVWTTIELSFNCLKNKEAQILFLLCSLFPEDALIEVQKLASYGLALHLFGDNCRLDNAMLRVYGLVDRLISCSLLLSAVDEDGNFCVKMHDVIREVAIDIASRDEYNFFIGADWPKTDHLAKKYAISLNVDENRNTGGSALGNCGWQCSNLQIFYLRFSYSDTTISIDFLKGMENLRVLDIADNDFRRPPTLQPLVNSVIEQLTNLEYISIAGYWKEGLPTFKDLTHLKVLDLSTCRNLRSIPTGAIASLTQLEGLLLNLDVSRVNLVELQLCRNLKVLQAPLRIVDLSQMPDNVVSNVQSILSSLSSFNINITNSTELNYYTFLRMELGKNQGKLFPKVLFFEDIDICCPIKFPSMTKLWEELQVLCCYNVEGLPSLMGIKFWSLRALQVTRCGDMKYIVEPHVLSKLNFLQLSDLPQLTGIFGQDGALWKNLFPALREIILDSLPNFKGGTKSISAADDVRYLFGPEDSLPAVETMVIECIGCDEIWHCPRQDGAFSQLRELRVFKLPHLRSLFPSLTFCTQVLLRLETLEIKNCGNLQVVISRTVEGDGDEHVTNETTIISVMPCLKEITLRNLQCLFFFYEGRHTLKFPLLRRIDLIACPQWKSFARRSTIIPRLINPQGSLVGEFNTWINENLPSEYPFSQRRAGHHRRIRTRMRPELG